VSDLMLFGVLQMPLDMTMANDVSRSQFHGRAQEAVKRIKSDAARIKQLEAQVARLATAARQVLSDIDDDGIAERDDMGVLALRRAAAQASTKAPHDDYVQGIVYACARLIEVDGMRTYAEDILIGAGVDASLGLETDLVFIRQIEGFETLPSGQV